MTGKTVLLRTIKTKKSGWREKSVSVVPPSVQIALREAMKEEKVPDSDFDTLLWIMAQESVGKVDAQNSKSSARGLYQLTKAHYHLNPRGVDSFGNAKEECQGGIRYILRRYRSADKAKAFWLKNHWY